MKTRCPLCNSKSLIPFLERYNVHVLTNVIINSYEEAISCKRGSLKLVFCTECEFIFNQLFEPDIIKYDQDYENTQIYSLAYNETLNELVNYLITKKDIKNSTIVEIGCGKGDFLRKLIELDEGNEGYGFDTSYVKSNKDENQRLHFQNCYYDSKFTSDMNVDAIVCRHVLEHIPDPLDLISTIKLGLKNSPHTKIFFEVPSIEWVIKNGLIWDFGYEHCSYFTPKSLRFLFESCGFKVTDVRYVFNGQALWMEATNETIPNKARLENSKSILQLINEYPKLESKIFSEMNKIILKLREKGRVAIWSAGGKGILFANMFDPHCELIDYVIDINPKKQGKFVAGSGHKIIGIDRIKEFNIKTAIVMNPFYYNEIKSMVSQQRLKIDLIDLIPYQAKIMTNC